MAYTVQMSELQRNLIVMGLERLVGDKLAMSALEALPGDHEGVSGDENAAGEAQVLLDMFKELPEQDAECPPNSTHGFCL